MTGWRPGVPRAGLIGVPYLDRESREKRKEPGILGDFWLGYILGFVTAVVAVVTIP